MSRFYKDTRDLRRDAILNAAARTEYKRRAEAVREQLRDPSDPEIIRAVKEDNLREICDFTGVNERDKDGRTALMWAVRLKKQRSVWRLLDKGADVTLLDNHGFSAVYYAAYVRPFYRYMFRLLWGATTSTFRKEFRKKTRERDGVGVTIGLISEINIARVVGVSALHSD